MGRINPADRQGLARYVPRQLMADLTSSSQNWDRPSIQRRPGAILFVDIAGFTSLTDKFAEVGAQGAEELSELLNRYFGRMTDLVESFGGDVVSFAGDAVIAQFVFGKEPRQMLAAACACALALNKEMASGALSQEQVTLRHRLAIALGELETFRVGGESGRWFYIVSGQPLKDIAECLAEAEPGEILLSATSVRAAPGVAAGQISPFGRMRLTKLVDGVTTNVISPTLEMVPPEEWLRPFVPRVVVERFNAGQLAWLAEFRQITIGFVKLPPLPSSDPKILDKFQHISGLILRQIFRFDGAALQVLSDDKGLLILAAFGLPPYTSDRQAVRAMDAMLAIQENLAAEKIRVTAGLTTGRVFCGDYGSENRRQYTTVGPIMNLAARLMQQADNQILVDEATFKAVGPLFKFSQAVNLTLKGKTGQVTSYKLLERNRRLDREGGQRKQVIGRLSEIDIIRRAVLEAKEGRGQFLSIEGDPGMGKSILLGEACRIARENKMTILRTEATVVEQNSPYFVWRDLLAILVSGSPVTAPALLKPKLLEMLADDPQSMTWQGLLNDILPLDLPETNLTQQMTSQARSIAIQQILTGLIATALDDNPILLAIDDFQWLDTSSAAVLATLVRLLPNLLIVTASRPIDAGREPELMTLLQETTGDRINLGAMSAPDVRQLVANRLNISEMPEKLAEFIFSRSEGHPFYSEELAIALKESGVVRVEEDIVYFDPDVLGSANVPDSLQGIIVSRIDRLPASSQLTLKVASAIGRVFESSLLEAIYPIAEDLPHINQIVEGLVGPDLVRRENALQQTYFFKHIITQEVAFDLLVFSQRRKLSRLIAEEIEKIHADDLSGQYVRLALYWERAEEFGKSVDYLEKSAEIAIKRYANREAIDHLRRLRGICKTHNLSRDVERMANWDRLQGIAHHELSEYAKAGEYLLAAVRHYDRPAPTNGLALSADLVKQILVQVGLSNHIGLLAKLGGGVRPFDAIAADLYFRLTEIAYFSNDQIGQLYRTIVSLNLAEAGGSEAFLIAGAGNLSVGLSSIPALRAIASSYHKKSLALAETTQDIGAAAYAHLVAGTYQAAFGDWVAVTAHMQKASELYLQIGHRFRNQQCWTSLCFSAIAQGDFIKAREILSQLETELKQTPFPQVEAWVSQMRTTLALASGIDLSSKILHVEQSLSSGELVAGDRMISEALISIGYLREQRYEEALAAADRSMALIKAHPPAVYFMVVGIANVARTYLNLLENGKYPIEPWKLRQRSRQAIEELQAFADRVPMALPMVTLLRGRLFRALGRKRDSIELWQKTLKLADQYHMPLERGLAQMMLAKHLDQSQNDRDQRFNEAKSIFSRLGALHYLNQLETIRQNIA